MLKDMYFRKKQIVKILSGNAFKVFYTILETTIRERKINPEFDGWIKVSQNQLKTMTGVQAIFRVVDEFKQNPDIIEIISEDGVPSRYRISEELINERINENFNTVKVR